MRLGFRLTTVGLASLASFGLSRPAAGAVLHPLAVQQGDTVVRMAGPARYPGGGTLVTELSIGGNDAPEYQFTRIGDILPARDGTIWIEDVPGTGVGSPPIIRQYDAKGKYLRTIGRLGQGPGEYSTRANSVAQLPDGRVLLRDDFARKMLLYSETGEPLDPWPHPVRYNGLLRSRGRLTVDTAGIVYMRILLPDRPDDPDGTSHYATVRFSPRGTFIDTVPEPELGVPPRQSIRVSPTPESRGGIIFGAPFAPYASWTWSPLGYMVTTPGSQYAIDLRIPAPAPGGAPIWRPGGRVVSIRRDAPPVRLTAAEHRDQEDYLEAQVDAARGTRHGSIPPVPRVKPMIRYLAVGTDGRIWAYVSTPSERYSAPRTTNAAGEQRPAIDWREPFAVDVFEPTGAYLGRISIPDSVYLITMQGDTAWGVDRDEDGVPTVKRYRIAWR